MKKITKLVLIGLLVLGFVNVSRAEDGSKERTVRVQGEGKITAVPDQAELIFGVEEESVQLKDASTKAREKMKKIFQVIKSFGISEKDYQTINFNIQPKMKYDKGETTKTGYIVTNRIKVMIKDLDQVGKVLEAVTDQDVSQVEGPNFSFSDPSKLEIAALKAAVEDAHKKALALADSAEAGLGSVFSINQLSSNMPSPRPMMMYMANKSAAGAGAVPIAQGQDDVSAQVEVVYLLK